MLVVGGVGGFSERRSIARFSTILRVSSVFSMKGLVSPGRAL